MIKNDSESNLNLLDGKLKLLIAAAVWMKAVKTM
jgi:hypothetical protein